MISDSTTKRTKKRLDGIRSRVESSDGSDVVISSQLKEKKGEKKKKQDSPFI